MVAVAQSDTIKVYISAWVDWPDGIYREHNHDYVDDALLTAVGPMTNTVYLSFIAR